MPFSVSAMPRRANTTPSGVTRKCRWPTRDNASSSAARGGPSGSAPAVSKCDRWRRQTGCTVGSKAPPVSSAKRAQAAGELQQRSSGKQLRKCLDPSISGGEIASATAQEHAEFARLNFSQDGPAPDRVGRVLGRLLLEVEVLRHTGQR